MTARHISCTSQRDHDEANEIVQHNKRPMGIPFLTPMNDGILNWASGSPVNSGTYHMYEEERQLYCPILEIKSLQNFFSSIGDTAVHTGSGPRSLKTK